MKKDYISAESLLKDSYKLAWKIYQSNFIPNYIVGVWRGGAPVGIAVQEFLEVLGVNADHIAIRTSSYRGINSRDKEIKVHGLGYIVERLESEDSLLIVDDVYDTGLSIQQTIKDINSICKKNTPTIKVATPYFKPNNNMTDTRPDFYVHENDNWLVFPHELHGLTFDEIKENKPVLSEIIDEIKNLIPS